MNRHEEFAHSAEALYTLVNGQLTEGDNRLFQAHFNRLLNIADALFHENREHHLHQNQDHYTYEEEFS